MKHIKFNNFGLANLIGVVTLFNCVLAVIAFLKDIVFAAYLGTSTQADALVLAYFLPENFGNSLIAASIGISCVPIFSKLVVKKKTDQFQKAVKNIHIYFLLLSLGLVLIFYVFRYEIIGLLGSGFSNNSLALSTKLYSILLPTMLVFPLITIGNAILQAENHFKIPAFIPIVYNLFFIFGIIFPMINGFEMEKGVYFISFGIISGILSMWVILLFSAKRTYQRVLKTDHFFNFFSPTDEENKDITDILKIFFPYAGVLLSTMAVLMVERSLASQLSVGTISGLNYAYRLVQFPVWVFAASVSTVILPSMSKASESGFKVELKSVFGKALKIIVMVSFPISLFLFFLRVPILTLLFKRGEFNEASLFITSGLLGGYALAIVGQCVLYVFIRYYVAIGKMKTPMFIILCTSILNVLLDIYLVKKIGANGLGYGSAISSIFNIVLMMIVLKKQVGYNLPNQIKYFLRILIASIPTTIILLFGNVLWSGIAPLNLFSQAIFIFIFFSLAAIPYIWILIKVIHR